MKKNCRLLTSTEFKNVLDQRRCAGKNDSVSVFYSPNDSTHARVGVSVSNKIGNAVTRVRIRRQLRAQVNISGILSKPYDIVIIARSGYLNRTFSENVKTLTDFLSHVGTKEKGEKHEN